MSVEWTWRDKPVHNPWVKVALAVWMLLGVMFWVTYGVVFVVLTIVLLPVWLPIDLVLKAFGKRGFAYHDRVENSYNIKFNLGAFR